MLNKAIILVISIFLLSSCVTGPEGYFKRSANNKLFDRKGFKGSKRPPLYNKKYIAKAKQNVAINDYDEDDENEEEDELLENENISRANREMYRYMLEQDVENKYLGKKARSRKGQAYPSLVKTNNRFDDQGGTENLELRAELEQIKSMLNETKDQMANYRCPTSAELERAQARSGADEPVSRTKANPAKSTKAKSNAGQQSENDKSNSTIVKPVKSI